MERVLDAWFLIKLLFFANDLIYSNDIYIKLSVFMILLININYYYCLMETKFLNMYNKYSRNHIICVNYIF